MDILSSHTDGDNGMTTRRVGVHIVSTHSPRGEEEEEEEEEKEEGERGTGTGRRW